jgi:hypothetical protein
MADCVARLTAKIKNEPEKFYYHLLSTCSITIIAYATRLHVDTPKVHPFIPLKSFWENKWIIDVPSKVLDHSYNLCDKYAWDKSDRELFRELVRVAAEQGLGGPDAMEERASFPALMEAALEELGDYHLETS